MSAPPLTAPSATTSTAGGNAAIAASIGVQRGAFNLEAALTVAPGERVAVIGPNGSGKSTLLACLAGVIEPDDGEIWSDGTILDRAGRRGMHVPPERRAIGLLGAQPYLFPHLSVADNVSYGPRSQRRESRECTEHYLSLFDCTQFARRRPAELSSGQRQRVALARAFAAEPRVLLCDEALSALDVAAATEVRRLLAEVLRGRTAMLATHNVVDVLAISTRTIVLENGRIVDDGPSGRVLFEPRTVFAARLAGLNIVPGQVSGGTFRCPLGDFTADGVGSGAAFAAVPYRAVRVRPINQSETLTERADGRASHHDHSHLRMRVTDVMPASGGARLMLESPISLIADVSLATALPPGGSVAGTAVEVWADREAVHVFQPS